MIQKLATMFRVVALLNPAGPMPSVIAAARGARPPARGHFDN
jgi:hypothetical protein